MKALLIGHTGEIGRAILSEMQCMYDGVICWSRLYGVDISESSTIPEIPKVSAIVLVANCGEAAINNVINIAKKSMDESGSIVIVSSVHVLMSNDEYATSKMTQERIAIQSAVDLKMRINILRIGHITPSKSWPREDKSRIPEIPLGRFGTPREVASAVEFMLDSRWMCGSILTLDGGISAQLSLNNQKNRSN